MPLRNPALAAMEIATIARLFPDRFVPAVGHGVLDWMGQVGARVDVADDAAPASMPSRSATCWTGHRVDTAGRSSPLMASPSTGRRRHVPRCCSAPRGDKTILLAGEVAHGVLLDSVTGARLVAAGVLSWTRAVRRRAGRGGRTVTVYTRSSTRRQPSATLAQQVPERVGTLLEAGADAVVLQATDDHPDPMPLVEALATSGLV